ncbi:hypothetical protein T10_4799 [Trichinella papuae]|uniref:Uncharacterized protein n=1 Tax=Trichinella papuae TaxID=268474 RepID=A0A0V1N0J5_9BILA|nr:hypothetical protein T10_4799 [Trichinella papuae]
MITWLPLFPMSRQCALLYMYEQYFQQSATYSSAYNHCFYLYLIFKLKRLPFQELKNYAQHSRPNDHESVKFPTGDY